jgi:predicted DNA-binding protein
VGSKTINWVSFVRFQNRGFFFPREMRGKFLSLADKKKSTMTYYAKEFCEKNVPKSTDFKELLF